VPEAELPPKKKEGAGRPKLSDSEKAARKVQKEAAQAARKAEKKEKEDAKAKKNGSCPKSAALLSKWMKKPETPAPTQEAFDPFVRGDEAVNENFLKFLEEEERPRSPSQVLEEYRPPSPAVEDVPQNDADGSQFMELFDDEPLESMERGLMECMLEDVPLDSTYTL